MLVLELYTAYMCLNLRLYIRIQLHYVVYLFDSVKTQNALTKYLPVLSSVSSLQLMHLCSSKHYITYWLFLSSAMAQYSFSVMTDFVFCFVCFFGFF